MERETEMNNLCKSKKKYNSLKSAQQAQEKDRLDYGTYQHIYDCKDCEFYHLSKLSRKQNLQLQEKATERQRNKNVLSTEKSLELFNSLKEK